MVVVSLVQLIRHLLLSKHAVNICQSAYCACSVLVACMDVSLTPSVAGEPSGELKSAIEKDFGSFDEFKKQFSTAGATQFGSGWAWLVKDGGKLKVSF